MIYGQMVPGLDIWYTNKSRMVFQNGGIVFRKASRLDGPTISNPHAKTSGVNVIPVKLVLL